MTESDWWALVKVQLDRWGDSCRIESTTGGGVPDVNYAIDGHHGWIELKVAKAGKLYFERFQIPWMRRRLRHMDAVWVLALVDDELRLYHAGDIVHAQCHVESNKTKTWTVVEVNGIVATVSGPRPWPWHDVFTILTNRPCSNQRKIILND